MVFVDNLLFENHMMDSTVLGEGHFEYMEINIFWNFIINTDLENATVIHVTYR